MGSLYFPSGLRFLCVLSKLPHWLSPLRSFAGSITTQIDLFGKGGMNGCNDDDGACFVIAAPATKKLINMWEQDAFVWETGGTIWVEKALHEAAPIFAVGQGSGFLASGSARIAYEPVQRRQGPICRVPDDQVTRTHNDGVGDKETPDGGLWIAVPVIVSRNQPCFPSHGVNSSSASVADCNGMRVSGA